MEVISQILSNEPLKAAVVAWCIAQGLKVIINIIENGSLDLTRVYGAGGMPSSHTSFVVALCVNIGKIFGFGSGLFALSAGLAAVVMYDAVGIRRAAGKQAAAINKLFYHQGIPLEQQLKELLGHTPLQVAAGTVLGIVVGAVL